MSMLITIVMIPILKGYSHKLRAVDYPNPRKVHAQPMPKVGGLAVALGALVPVVMWMKPDTFSGALLVGAGIIVAFGFTDDVRNLNYKSKMVGQLLAALVVVLWGGVKIKCFGIYFSQECFLPDVVAIPFTVFVIIGVTNAINLADGLDGLAGGMSLLTFIATGFIAYQVEVMPVVIFSVAMIGAIIGFLRFNTHPAVVFLGDAGSQLIGFVAVVLTLYLSQTSEPLSPVLPMLLIGFPILDTLTVMTERKLEGKSPFLPDNKHYHHRLMSLGLYHTEAVFTIYVLQAVIVTTGYLFRFHTAGFLLLLYLLFSGCILSFFLLADRRQWKIRARQRFDTEIKGRLKILKDHHLLIKVAFIPLEILLPVLLALTALLPTAIPRPFGLGGLVALPLLALLYGLRRQWFKTAVRVVLYCLIPYLVYLSELERMPGFPVAANRLYNLGYAAGLHAGGADA
jgi:UDP-GlcNAc:undecaprenyl-phosphate GlcNAc-1-phosphate transferase